MWKPEMYYFFRLTEMSETVFTCILDDFNCDMLDLDNSPKEGRDFVDIIDIFAFENLICEVTRITNNWQTLLDLVSTNRKSRLLRAGVSNLHISDHALIYAIIHASSRKCRSQKICLCRMKTFDLDIFCADLNCALFVMVMNSCEDVDSKLFAFQSMHTSIILDEHVPMKTCFPCNQVPFMNEVWRKAINVIKCNLGKVNLEAMLLGRFPSYAGGLPNASSRGTSWLVYAVACLQFFAKCCHNSLCLPFCAVFYSSSNNDYSLDQQQSVCWFLRREFATRCASEHRVFCAFFAPVHGKLCATILFDRLRPLCR